MPLGAALIMGGVAGLAVGATSCCTGYGRRGRWVLIGAVVVFVGLASCCHWVLSWSWEASLVGSYWVLS